MEGTLEAEALLEHDLKSFPFQSISSWKVLWKTAAFLELRVSLPVSIHLFMEGTLEVSRKWDMLAQEKLFQSISSWKVLWKSPGGLPDTFTNHVSIHLFMEGTLEVYRAGCSDNPMALVSIHLFMEGTLEEIELIELVLIGRFQSISSWKVLWKLPANVRSLQERQVSIHLFMEGTLEG